MHCGTECSCGCMGERVEVITLSGCFLGKERRRIPGWRRGSVEGTIANEGHFFYYVCKLYFLFFKRNTTFAPTWTFPLKSGKYFLPALATLHQPLQAVSEIHSSVMFAHGVFLSVMSSFFVFEKFAGWFSSSFLCYIECTFY